MAEDSNAPDHVRRNRALRDAGGHEWAKSDRGAWARAEPAWGIWGTPEHELHRLPDELAGVDVVELERGTA